MKMIKKAGPFAIFCIIILLSLPVAAKAADDGLEYTVQKGDTLWDISSGKLKDPFLWPKLWKANPHIHNPHLIFPNETVVIPAELLKEELRAESRVKIATKRKLITSESLRTLSGSKKRPIVDREVLLQSGYFAKDVNHMGRIAGSPLTKTLLGSGDLVYLSTEVKVNPDEKFYVVTEPETIMNPLNEEIAGYQVRIKGVITVTGDENGKPQAVINESFEEINLGDMIISYYPVSLPFEPSILRKPNIGGIVLGIWNKRAESGTYDVVYLNTGTEHGVEIGDLFTVTSAAELNPVVGNIQVFAVSDAGSAAIVKKAIREIRPGDTFGN
jgi:LysM repeat protein